METKAHCAEQKRKLGPKGPWKSVALTLRMVEKVKNRGLVLIADSWFGSVACILALYEVATFAVMNVKTVHKRFPKNALLKLLGYDKKKKLCPKHRRGEYYGFTQKYETAAGPCEVLAAQLAAGHNSKRPVLVVSTASVMTPADDYTKTWTWVDAAGDLVKYTIRVATTMVHAMYHRWFHIVDVHNHLRQGLVSMADVWATKNWAHRHFAEGLGFWEVNVYRSLLFFHPHWKSKRLGHGKFRGRLAHAFLTLGKVEFNTAGGSHAAQAEPTAEEKGRHKIEKFANYDNEHHKCGYCGTVHGYFFCRTCFPDGKATHALCFNRSKGECFEKHALKVQPAFGCRVGIAKKSAVCSSPRLAAKQKRRPASDPAPAARRRIQ